MPAVAARISPLPTDPCPLAPPSSPLSCDASLSLFASSFMKYPVSLPTPTTSTCNCAPSLSSYSHSLSNDESASSDSVSSHWRPDVGVECAPTCPTTATTTATATATSHIHNHNSYDQTASLAAGPASDRAASCPPSRPANAPVRRVASVIIMSPAAPTAGQSANQPSSRRKRTDTTALSADQRLQRRRVQHRAVDAIRRHKETAAVARLHKLIEQQRAGHARLEGEADAGESGVVQEADDDAAVEASRKAGRLSVLESCIAMIEQLTTACKRMETACNAKDEQVSHVSSRLHSVAAAIAQQATALALMEPTNGLALPTMECAQQPWKPALLSTSSYLVHSNLSSTLRQTTHSLLNDMDLMLIGLPCKLVVDVNERFLQMAGHVRSDVLHQSLDRTSMNNNISQYPSSLATVEEVMTGSRRQCVCVWRCRMSNGLLYECTASFCGCYDDTLWQGNSVSVREKRIPDKVLIMCASDEVVIVDDSDQMLKADVA